MPDRAIRTGRDRALLDEAWTLLSAETRAAVSERLMPFDGGGEISAEEFLAELLGWWRRVRPAGFEGFRGLQRRSLAVAVEDWTRRRLGAFSGLGHDAAGE